MEKKSLGGDIKQINVYCEREESHKKTDDNIKGEETDKLVTFSFIKYYL